MDVSQTFIRLIRTIVGLPIDGAPPVIDRLALYRASVSACTSDGSKCDVQPEDKRISGQKNVKIKAGIPGSYAVVSDGAIVLLGWEGGDPAKAYVVPSWESAMVTKLVFKAALLYLIDTSGADNIVTKQDLDAIKIAISGAAVVANDGGAALKANIIAAWPASVGSQKAFAAR